MRIAGAFMLMAAFLLYGVGAVRERRSRLCCLRDLSLALELLQGELELHASPLPEAIQTVARYSTGAAERLFRLLSAELACLGEEAFAVLWKRAVRESCAVLQPRELDELERLGLALGRYELSTQLRELGACRAVLLGSREEAEHTFPSERRLWIGLSASVGALVAILLL